MQEQILTLKDVSLDKLKPLFSLSSSLNKTDNTLNMQLSPTGLLSSNKNESSSVIKTWHIPFSAFCSEIIGTIPEKLKISIFNGDDFSKKLLSYFGQLATIEIHHNGQSAKKLLIKKVNKDGKVELKIDVIAANVEIAYFEFTSEEQQILFGEIEQFSKKEIFTISKNDIQNIKKLLKLTSNAELQKKYVRLYSDEGMIKATDQGFDLTLFEDTIGLGDLKIEIDKKMFMLIDDGSYKATYAKYEENSEKMESLILQAENSDSNRRISLNLLQDIGNVADEIDWDSDFGDGDGFE